MSFIGTTTPRKTGEKAKWQLRKEKGRRAWTYILDGENRERFIKKYPKHSTRRIMLWFGISYATAHRFARELGLQKDMKAINREHAKDTKKTCEENGHYAAMRGRKLTPEQREAIRQWRANNPHPLVTLKKENPQRYRRLMQKRADSRRELWRKEKLRMKYGLERQTRLRVVESPLSKAAINQRYAMERYCNYYKDPDFPRCIFYDAETTRSEKREARARKYGFKIMEGGGE